MYASNKAGRKDCCARWHCRSGDDIGWADFSYNNGTAASPHVKAWTEADGTIVMQASLQLHPVHAFLVTFLDL